MTDLATDFEQRLASCDPKLNVWQGEQENSFRLNATFAEGVTIYRSPAYLKEFQVVLTQYESQSPCIKFLPTTIDYFRDVSKPINTSCVDLLASLCNCNEVGEYRYDNTDLRMRPIAPLPSDLRINYWTSILLHDRDPKLRTAARYFLQQLTEEASKK